MPRLIMKEAPGVDWYVEWTTVSEGVTWAGTRAEALAMLQRRGSQHVADFTPEERLAYCDEHGTTARWEFAEGGWDDKGFVFNQQGWLSRANVFELGRRLDDDDISDLLEPLEGRDDVVTIQLPKVPE